MITNLLTTKSLLRQFLTFNFFVFVILGFFTFLYLLAIEPELINKKSKKHQNIIENISLNLSNQKVRGDKESLEIFLYKSNFILDEVDQIRFYNFQKDILADSSLIDIDRKSLFVTERIQTLGINEQAALEQDKQNFKNISKIDHIFLKDISEISEQKFYIYPETKNNNLIVHTSSVLNLGSEKIIITISDISNEII